MKTFFDYVLMTLLAVATTFAHAATEQVEQLAPEPTVSIVWVVLFFIAFVGVCVGIGVGVYRADRANKSAAEKKA